jgi:alkylation response protein AidB-like acyl-CoA dehydrogenase
VWKYTRLPPPGISVGSSPAMGVRAAATGEVRFDDVHASAAKLIAGGDPEASADCVRGARLAWCAMAIGSARAVLDHMIPYVNERTAFGEPISTAGRSASGRTFPQLRAEP